MRVRRHCNRDELFRGANPHSPPIWVTRYHCHLLLCSVVPSSHSQMSVCHAAWQPIFEKKGTPRSPPTLIDSHSPTIPQPHCSTVLLLPVQLRWLRGVGRLAPAQMFYVVIQYHVRFIPDAVFLFHSLSFLTVPLVSILPLLSSITWTKP